MRSFRLRPTQFKRDVRRAEKRGKNLAKLRELVAALIQQKPLSARYLDHPLRGRPERMTSRPLRTAAIYSSFPRRQTCWPWTRSC